MFCTNCGFEMGESQFCSDCGSRRSEGALSPGASVTHTPTASAGLLDRWKTFSAPVKGLIAAGVSVLLIVLMSAAGVFENRDISECKRLVRDSLKAPSSAAFLEASVTYDTAGDTGERTISVKGTVEAENGFGVRVIGDYWCTNYNTDALELEYLTSR